MHSNYIKCIRSNYFIKKQENIIKDGSAFILSVKKNGFWATAAMFTLLSRGSGISSGRGGSGGGGFGGGSFGGGGAGGSW